MGSPSRDADRFVEELIEGVYRLAVFAIQAGQLPPALKTSVVYEARRALDEGKSIETAVVEELIASYQALKREFPEVTAKSLMATEPKKPGNALSSPVGGYLKWLWTGTALALALVATSFAFQFYYDVRLPEPGDELAPSDWLWVGVHEFFNYLEPFLYGALGAIVYLLRITAELLRSREFDPARKLEHINRVVLGTMSGGTIVLLVGQLDAGGGTIIEVSTAALGFLAGYSVEFLFETLDRVIRAILPKVGLDSIRSQARDDRVQKLLLEYQAKFDQTTDKKLKDQLGQIIEDLKRR